VECLSGVVRRQALKNGLVQAEYLGEAFVKRSSTFTPDLSNPDIVRTSDSTYKLIANRTVTNESITPVWISVGGVFCDACRLIR